MTCGSFFMSPNGCHFPIFDVLKFSLKCKIVTNTIGIILQRKIILGHLFLSASDTTMQHEK